MAVRTCRVCALSWPVEPNGACYCYKYQRIIKPQECEWDWGCLYFTEIVPDEDLTAYQYLLIKETELATKK